MDLKSVGVLLGGVGVVAGLAYANARRGRSLAEFSSGRGKVVEDKMMKFGKVAEVHDNSLGELKYWSGEYAESSEYMKKALKLLWRAFNDSSPEERAEIVAKLPEIYAMDSRSDPDAIADRWKNRKQIVQEILSRPDGEEMLLEWAYHRGIPVAVSEDLPLDEDIDNFLFERLSAYREG